MTKGGRHALIPQLVNVQQLKHTRLASEASFQEKLSHTSPSNIELHANHAMNSTSRYECQQCKQHLGALLYWQQACPGIATAKTKYDAADKCHAMMCLLQS